MIHITIDAAHRNIRTKSLLQKAAETTLIREGNKDSDLSLVLTTDKKLRPLNRQFRGIDQVTDVLSFPGDLKGNEPGYLGDVIISVERAKAQAKEAGHSLSNELSLLTIHGVLHLLGYDHGEPAAKAKMWVAQNKILQALGITLDVDPAVEAYSKH